MGTASNLFDRYAIPPETLDEVFSDFPATQTAYSSISDHFAGYDRDTFEKLNANAKISFLNQGITYAVYSEEGGGTEKIFPFDLFPRVIEAEEWSSLENGLEQRNRALNLFLNDVYGKQLILRDGVVPAELVLSSPHYRKFMREVKPVGEVYSHICGTDLIRHADGKMYVLEDNMRSPSGVSYVLSNREAMRRTMYRLFKNNAVRPVHTYPDLLGETLCSVSPRDVDNAKCVLLTPGRYNSAYYEHSLLARLMGIDLVEGRDLYVENDRVYLRTIRGNVLVDVIYRRIDDDYLDPAEFLPDSMLGVRGVIGAYRKGNVTIVNAPGTGVSDDKAICAYVPEMIKYYLDQDPIIPNVPTYICGREKDLDYTLNHLAELVVKPVDMSGGYGVTICDRLNDTELEEVKRQIKANPRNYIAQPKMMLSLHPTYVGEDQNAAFAPRHIDLRTFTLMGKDTVSVLPGGLTRVALREGSLIVNSSQGGGSKDTWVIAEN